MKKIGLVILEEKSFKGVYGRMDGRRTLSVHNNSSWAFRSGELKNY